MEDNCSIGDENLNTNGSKNEISGLENQEYSSTSESRNEISGLESQEFTSTSGSKNDDPLWTGSQDTEWFSDSESESDEDTVPESEGFDTYAIHDLAKDPLKLIKWCQEKGLLATSRECPKCNQEMLLSEKGDNRDVYVWRCRKRRKMPKQGGTQKCDTSISIRKDSFFENHKLTLREILLLCYFYLYKLGAQIEVARNHHVTPKTVSEWNYYCREVAVEEVLLTSQQIGGPGKIVEIDESMFGKRKYNRGKRVEGTWVFGGIERESNRFFMVPVDKRDKTTLLGIIKDWIRPGTTIISDFWKAYDALDEDPDFTHLKVNHSLHFKDPETGAHTNRIEGAWSHAKSSMPKGGRRKRFLAGYLAMHMFRCKLKSDKKNIFFGFLEAVSRLYNPMNPKPTQE